MKIVLMKLFPSLQNELASCVSIGVGIARSVLEAASREIFAFHDAESCTFLFPFYLRRPNPSKRESIVRRYARIPSSLV